MSLWHSLTRTSDMDKHTVQRPRHLGEIERVDEQARVSDLPSAAAAHEAPKLLLDGPPSPRRLLLQDAKRSEVALGGHDPFHGGGTEGADQLVLEVCDAQVETESFHVRASEVGAEAGPLEGAPEVSLLRSVTEARHSDAMPLGAEQIQEASDVRRTTHRDNRDAFSVEVPTTALSERFERDLVAHPFNEDDRAGGEGPTRR